MPADFSKYGGTDETTTKTPADFSKYGGQSDEQKPEDDSYSVGKFAKGVGEKIAGIPRAISETSGAAKEAIGEFSEHPVESTLTGVGSAINQTTFGGAKKLGAKVESALGNGTEQEVLDKYAKREQENPGSAATGRFAGNTGLAVGTTALAAVAAPEIAATGIGGLAAGLLGLGTADVSSQVADTGTVDPRQLAENVTAGGLVGEGLKLGGGALKTAGKTGAKLTEAIAPERAKASVQRFTQNPQELTEAQHTSTKIPELRQQLRQQSGQAETQIQNKLNSEKVRIGGLYSDAAEAAKNASEMHPDPENSTSEHIRFNIENSLNDPKLANVRSDLEKAVKEVGVNYGSDTIHNPRNYETHPVTGADTDTISGYKDFTTGNNLDMSVEFRKRLDAVIDPYKKAAESGMPGALDVNELATYNKLKQLRQSVDKQIKEGTDFDPTAQKALNKADTEFAKYANAKKVIMKNTGQSLGKGPKVTDASKIGKLSGSLSPAQTEAISGALSDVGTPDALNPMRDTRSELANQRDLAIAHKNLNAPGLIPGTSKAVKLGVYGSNALQNAGETVGNNSQVNQAMQGVAAITQPQISNLTGKNNSEIDQAFKDNPSAASWLKVAGKTLKSSIPESAVISAAKQYNTDPQRLKDALIRLGKTVTP